MSTPPPYLTTHIKPASTPQPHIALCFLAFKVEKYPPVAYNFPAFEAFPCSSMVEHLTVNQVVAGSSPAGGVNFSVSNKVV